MNLSIKFTLFCVAATVAMGGMAATFPERAVEIAMIAPAVLLLLLSFALKRGWFLLDRVASLEVQVEDAAGDLLTLRGPEAVEFMHQKMKQYQRERDRERVKVLRAFCAGYEAKQEGRAKLEAVNEFVGQQAEESTS